MFAVTVNTNGKGLRNDKTAEKNDATPFANEHFLGVF